MNYRSFLACMICALLVLTFSKLSYAQSPSGTEPNANAPMELLKRQSIAIRNAISESKKHIEEASAGIEKGIDSLRTKSVSDIAYDDVVRMLHLRKVELTIDMQGLNARLQMLKQEVEKLLSEDRKDEVSDTQRKLLLRYVANQEQAFKRLSVLREQGNVSSAEVHKAEQLLTESRIRLEEFDAKRRSASPVLVQSMFETTLAIAEKNAKLQAVEVMLQSHVGSRTDILKLKRLQEVRDTENTRIQRMLLDLREIELESSRF